MLNRFQRLLSLLVHRIIRGFVHRKRDCVLGFSVFGVLRCRDVILSIGSRGVVHRRTDGSNCTASKQGQDNQAFLHKSPFVHPPGCPEWSKG